MLISELEAGIDDSPYNINGWNFVLKEWRSGVALEEIKFDQISLWIQTYNLSRELMTVRNLNMIGGRIGVVVATEDPFADGLGRGFARVKVALDLKKPLEKELIVPKTSGASIKILLKYEKLHDFC